MGSVRKYAELIGVASPQVVYNMIATGKLKKGDQWRETQITKTKKEVLYEG